MYKTIASPKSKRSCDIDNSDGSGNRNQIFEYLQSVEKSV